MAVRNKHIITRVDEKDHADIHAAARTTNFSTGTFARAVLLWAADDIENAKTGEGLIDWEHLLNTYVK